MDAIVDEAPPKILSEFSLTPDAKKELQQFFDTHLHALRGPYDARAVAKDELKDVLRRVLPEQAQQTLAEIMAGTSEYSLLIHNLPERAEFIGGGPIPLELQRPENVYCNHIGCAIYEMYGTKSAGIEMLARSPKRSSEYKPFGSEIHRDVKRLRSDASQDQSYAAYVIFASPHNQEEAVTEVLNLKKAIASISEEVRQRTEAHIYTRAQNEDPGETTPRVTLDQVLRQLDEPLISQDHIRKIVLLSPPDSAEAKAFNDAVKRFGADVPLKHGDLLVLNQHKIFHRAHAGNVEAIDPGRRASRIFFANIGLSV